MAASNPAEGGVLLARLEDVIADRLENDMLGSIEVVLKQFGIEGVTWADFDVRDQAVDVAAKIAEYAVKDGRITMDEAIRVVPNDAIIVSLDDKRRANEKRDPDTEP
jgi:hypothetical protein